MVRRNAGPLKNLKNRSSKNFFTDSGNVRQLSVTPGARTSGEKFFWRENLRTHSRRPRRATRGSTVGAETEREVREGAT